MIRKVHGNGSSGWRSNVLGVVDMQVDGSRDIGGQLLKRVDNSDDPTSILWRFENGWAAHFGDFDLYFGCV